MEQLLICAEHCDLCRLFVQDFQVPPLTPIINIITSLFVLLSKISSGKPGVKFCVRSTSKHTVCYEFVLVFRNWIGEISYQSHKTTCVRYF